MSEILIYVAGFALAGALFFGPKMGGREVRPGE